MLKRKLYKGVLFTYIMKTKTNNKEIYVLMCEEVANHESFNMGIAYKKLSDCKADILARNSITQNDHNRIYHYFYMAISLI